MRPQFSRTIGPKPRRNAHRRDLPLLLAGLIGWGLLTGSPLMRPNEAPIDALTDEANAPPRAHRETPEPPAISSHPPRADAGKLTLPFD